MKPDRFEEPFAALTQLGYIIVGNIIYAVSINVLITPMGLYNGGFLGIAQLIRLFCVQVLHVPTPSGMDITGIIYFVMNVPLFYYSYKAVSAKFSVKSLLSIGMSSLCLTLVPVPETPLFDDYLSACVIAGVIGGVGSGMILRGGSSTGGSDIIGVCLSRTHPNMSVGRINVAFNLAVYGICLVVFNIQIAIYSFIYTTIRSTFMDRMHTQNINTQALIFTKMDGLDKIIARETGRGVTCWEGRGAYTDEDVHIMLTALSKYEVGHLRQMIMERDPHAFVLLNDGEQIIGNFKKYLD